MKGQKKWEALGDDKQSRLIRIEGLLLHGQKTWELWGLESMNPSLFFCFVNY